MLSFWFAPYPSTLSPSMYQFWSLAATGCFIVGFVLITVMKRRTTPRFRVLPWLRVGRVFVTGGILLAVLLFFRFEGIPFLAARFWLLILAFGVVVWGAFILRHFFVTVPRQARDQAARLEKQRFLR